MKRLSFQAAFTGSLTTGVDTFTGGKANDTFTANLANNDKGVANVATLTSFDSIDGGAGAGDTFNAFFIGAVTSVAGTLKNVENVNFNADNAFTANVSTWTGVTNLTVKATDTSKAVDMTSAATAVTLTGGTGNKVTDGSNATASKAVATTTVTLDGNLTTAATITGSGIANVTIANTAVKTNIVNAAGTSKGTLNLTVNNVTAGGTSAIEDTKDQYSTLNLTATGKASSTEVIGDSVTAMAVSGDAALTLIAAGLTKLATVTVAGAGGLTSDLSAASVTGIDASASSGTNSINVDGTKATFKGGSGADTVILTAAPTKAIDGGTGANTLSMTAIADLSTLTKTALANATNFQTIELTGKAGTTGGVKGENTLDVSGLPSGMVNVTLNSTTLQDALTLSNAATGMNLTVLADLNKNATVSLKTDGNTDTLNLTIGNAKSAAIDAAKATKIVATTFETVTVVANADTAAAAVQHKLILDDATATTLNISGAAGVDFTGSTLTKVATVAASTATGAIKVDLSGGVTAGVTVTTGTGADTITTAGAKDKIDTINSGTGNDTVTVGAGNNVITMGGGDTTTGVSLTIGNGNNTVVIGGGKVTMTAGTAGGNNTITTGDGDGAITVGNGNNTISAGGGKDTVTVGSGNNTVTLGAGADTLNIGTVNSSSAIFTTVKDIAAGDAIDFTTNIANATGKLGAALTSGVNDYQTFLNNAASKGAGTVSWFQFGGDTYVVQDIDAAGIYTGGTDLIVKLTGTVDLSNSTLVGGAQVLTIV